MSITALIVDDEAAARNRLRQALSDNHHLQVLGEARDGVEAVEKIEALAPQLIFLDIQMPGMDGFDVLRQLPKERMPAVIFVTAFDQYAIRAFEVSAIDYLLKPYSEERLHQALNRVVCSLATAHKDDVYKLLEQLPSEKIVRQLPVRAKKRIKLLSTDSICRIVSEHRLITVYDRNGARYWTNETLDQLQKRLDPEIFFRIHRSSIINMQADIELEPWDDGRLKVHFADGEVLTAAREPAKQLKQKMGL